MADIDAKKMETKNVQDLTLVVNKLLTDMQSKFQVMSDSIIGRIDEMGVRLDELERNVGELMHQSGIDDHNH
ncbi:hypothetical protein ACHWQZ_G013286 [Mnemiopsis leidyi]